MILVDRDLSVAVNDVFVLVFTLYRGEMHRELGLSTVVIALVVFTHHELRSRVSVDLVAGEVPHLLADVLDCVFIDAFCIDGAPESFDSKLDATE